MYPLTLDFDASNPPEYAGNVFCNQHFNVDWPVLNWRPKVEIYDNCKLSETLFPVVELKNFNQLHKATPTFQNSIFSNSPAADFFIHIPLSAADADQMIAQKKKDFIQNLVSNGSNQTILAETDLIYIVVKSGGSVITKYAMKVRKPISAGSNFNASLKYFPINDDGSIYFSAQNTVPVLNNGNYAQRGVGFIRLRGIEWYYR